MATADGLRGVCMLPLGFSVQQKTSEMIQLLAFSKDRTWLSGLCYSEWEHASAVQGILQVAGQLAQAVWDRRPMPMPGGPKHLSHGPHLQACTAQPASTSLDRPCALVGVLLVPPRAVKSSW
jgi:hypothetical protein